jgi:hypothetical protein
MEVRRGIVYPCQTMLDNIQIDASSYAVVKVDMVHQISKDLKLKVPPDGTTLTMWDAVTRRVQWKASASTNASQPNTSHALIFPETCLPSSLN